MSDGSEPTRFDKILGSITLIRIVSFLGIVTLFPPLRIPWQYTVAFFEGFFPFLIASFVMELVLKAKLRGFRKEFWPLYNRYIMSLPLEFLGVFILVMYSFKPNNGSIDLDEVRYASIPLIGGVILEILHRHIFPKIETRLLKESKEKISKLTTLLIIPLTVMIFFLGLYAIVMAEKHSVS